jgi:hypothetical protein
VSVWAVPNIPDPTLLKLPVAPPVPVKIPFIASFNVVPEPAAAIVPFPDPTPPAIPKRLAPFDVPPPKLVPEPPLDPVPTVATIPSPISVPVVVLPMLRVPVPVPKPPVGPVAKGVTVVVKVEGPKAVEVPPFLLLFLIVKAEPGTSVVTVLNPTGLTPAPKPPVPEVVVVPLKVRVPTPSMASTAPAFEPVPPAAEFPLAAMNGVSMKDDPLLELVKFPPPAELASPALAGSTVMAEPVPLAAPPPVEVPEMIPPVKGDLLPSDGNPCNFLDPLRLREVIVLLLEDACRIQGEGCRLKRI